MHMAATNDGVVWRSFEARVEMPRTYKVEVTRLEDSLGQGGYLIAVTNEDYITVAK